MLKKFLGRVVLLIVFICLFSSVSALDASNSSLFFDQVLPGGYAEDLIRLSTSTTDPVEVDLSVEGEISEWLSFDHRSISVSSVSPSEVGVSVSPPKDAKMGVHRGTIFLNYFSGGSGLTSVVNVVKFLNVTVVVSDKIVSHPQLAGFAVSDAEVGSPFVASFLVDNVGNVAVFPQVELRLSSLDGSLLKDLHGSLLKSSVGSFRLLPTVSKELLVSVPSTGLAPGRYLLTGSIFFSNNSPNLVDTAVFDGSSVLDDNSSASSSKKIFRVSRDVELLARGSLIDDLSVSKVIHFKKVGVNSSFVVSGFLNNSGSARLPALFVCKFFLNDSLVSTASSDLLFIAPGQVSASLNVSLPLSGFYQIKCFAEVNNVSSSAVMTSLEVGRPVVIPLSAGFFVIFLVLAALFIFFAKKKFEEKKKKSGKKVKKSKKKKTKNKNGKSKKKR